MKNRIFMIQMIVAPIMILALIAFTKYNTEFTTLFNTPILSFPLYQLLLWIFGGIFACLFLYGIIFVLQRSIYVIRNLSSNFILKRNPNIPLHSQYALLCGALLANSNGMYLNILKSGMPRGLSKKLMAEWWGIRSREEALDTIENLIKDNGHRQIYALLFPLTQVTEESEREKMLDALALDFWNHLDPEYRAEIEDGDDPDEKQDIIDSYRENLQGYLDNILLGKKRFAKLGILKHYTVPHIIAWDFGRAINLARWSYSLGWITEEEAWKYIHDAAREIQKSYATWEEMSVSYLLGRFMWGGYDDRMGFTEETHKMFLENPKSPWFKIDFKTPIPL